MINVTEEDEKEYLGEIRDRLTYAIRRVDDSVGEQSEELRQHKEYLYEYQSGLDEADWVAARQSINRMVSSGESVVARRRKLQKLLSSPYFGRIDFLVGDKHNAIYIGIYSFTDEATRSNLINDWRAPVSSMFYDFELGPASYQTPSGEIHGDIGLKRQYRIRDGRMEFMIENEVNIHDDVLQKELSKSSDDKMKNIVATIQRDQNAVIRNETANVMIIQGVAGSGKTSIALHRVAFLLYRFRDSIQAADVLIISPNKVFADYISNVLPELGEEQIPELTMEELAGQLLEHHHEFQTFFGQVSELLENPDPAFIDRIREKSSFEFLSKLNQYFIHVENNYFEPVELNAAGIVIPWPHILERFRANHRTPLLKRPFEVARDVLSYVRAHSQRKISPQERTHILQAIPKMLRVQTVFDFYKSFFKWIGKEALFKTGTGGKLEYSDVFPLIYCKIRLEGVQTYDNVKHLLVDEMQDYTPVQYAVLSRLFRCKKTILGDVGQTVNPYSASSAEVIERVFPQADVVRLHRSYRSTSEITSFAQHISANPDLIPMERHGAPPQVNGFPDNAGEAGAIEAMVLAFRTSGFVSLGIICKTQPQAEKLYEQIRASGVHLLTEDSTSFADGIVITTVHLAKGLEFDEVIIPYASAGNYKTEVDRKLLYIACTRAMHRLTLTWSKSGSGFIFPG